MEPSKEAIAVRITRLNRLILGKVTGGTKFNKKTICREALLDALTVLYDECNDDPIKRADELVKNFVDKYRSTLAELRMTRVCISDFETIQTIGRGHFGDVNMVREKQTGDVYALKTMRKEQTNKRAAEDERDVLANANSPWMPRLQYAFQDNNNLYLAMELCPGGDLAALLARRGRALPEREAAFYVGELAHALKALHALGYVHRDLKPHNVLLDRCGHVKVCDFGSAARLSERAGVAAGTADYMAPELLAAADCATHNVCQEYCGRLVTAAISACDYWSLGVIAFELVTLRRPFSSGDEDSIPQILSNIQKYERSTSPELPWEGAEDEEGRGASSAWRALVAGLVRVLPARRYSYLDVLQHAALAHLPAHHIRDQAPPWVPHVRGSEDASYFSPAPRPAPPPNAAPFRARPPFAGQLPFVGYSYVAPEENEDHSSGFNASHDCTAIDLATYKSAEKLAAMRSREIQVLQTKLAEAEASSGAAVQRAKHEADLEAERQRARLQADITALSLQNKRLERQVEVEREERMALQRTNQELSATLAERNSLEVRNAQAAAAALKKERDALQDNVRRLENQLDLLHAESKQAVADADAARSMHQHYKDIIEHVQELRHRRLTEINVRPIDSVAKERAIRRQTLSGGEAESREAAARVASAEANAAREARARQQAERRVTQLTDECRELRKEADDAKRELAAALEQLGEKQRVALTSSEQLREMQTQLAQERVRATTLLAQVQELERSVEEAVRREAALEEQCARTEARLAERLHIAEAQAAAALTDDQRHREKVNTLEQLVRQLEREVSALEKRTCVTCTSLACSAQPESDRHTDTQRNGTRDLSPSKDIKKDSQSDTESVADAAHTQAQLSLLKEQLERGEAQLQARAEEIAALRQEARAANLARWRKEREYNELSVEMKSTSRDLKRTEERLTSAIEARRAAEKKAGELVSELATLKPLHEQVAKEAQRLKEHLDKLTKTHEVVQAEVDRSRNDIRKLKSELQYSEKRRLHAEEQEEISSRERVTLRDELHQLREHNTELVQNNKALQEACSILEEQLTDLEKVCDIHEVKNNELESQLEKVRSELVSCRARLTDAEWQAGEQAAAAVRATQLQGEAREHARHAACEITLLRERLEARETRVAELEARVAALESEQAANEATQAAAARRLRDLQEESAALRTRAHHHHAHAMQLQATIADLQEELAGTREAAEAAGAWWRTRETKADATLRQQAKLIDFLQAKVEEVGRKKCSISNKLFGRSGRRPPTSPPLRRVNKELREEVERLRSKLAAFNSTCPDFNYSATPKREKLSSHYGQKQSNGSPSEGQDKGLLVVWADGSRERMRAKCADDVLVLSSGERELRARWLSTDAKNLPHNEANRAFVVRLEGGVPNTTAAVVCASISERDAWVSRVSTSAALSASPEYTPTLLATVAAPPAAALHLAPSVVAIGTSEGLHSLRGPVQLDWEDESSSTRAGASCGGVSCACAAGARVLLVCGAALGDVSRAALLSALRRAHSLKPTLRLARVHLPDDEQPRLVKTVSGRVSEDSDGTVAVVACARRVLVLQYGAAAARWTVGRAFEPPHGAPHALLVTRRALLGAGERAWLARQPGGAPQPLAPREPTVAAAAARRSPPKSLLLICEEPLELLVCYAECGVFLDERGERTRSEDPKWSSAVCGWEFVPPFLYVIGDDKVTVVRLDEDSYRAPPCTCDVASLASSTSECYLPQTYTVKVDEPALLGPAPSGILLSSKVAEGYRVSLLEGLSAFRSVGASVESLATLSESKGSTVDLIRSTTDVRVHEVSQESVEVTTDFLADIRKRARQLKEKNRIEKSADDVIKEILTTEVELKRTMSGRKSPASISDSDAESESSVPARSSADMFARQVRFQ